MPHPFPSLGQSVSFPAIDREILDFWSKDKTFEASVDHRPGQAAGGQDFVFYDGPPFANGLPHYGHLLTGYVKDLIPRYRTMKGCRVERRFGWDTHGLPAELQAEKELGISGRRAILKFGMADFNAHCRRSVLRFTDEWRDYVTRQARWVDFDNAYKTLDRSYMESVLWAFKTLYDKGLIYKDYRVVPYSWAVESPLSNFETRLDNFYRMRRDPAVTVALELEEPASGGPTHIAIWTTTPWTLPSNLAVAAGANIDYALVEDAQGRRIALSANAWPSYQKQMKDAQIVGRMKGRAFQGMRYKPPFDYFAGMANAHKVMLADFVEDGEGTGFVHLAPGFGEDDLNVCRAAGIDVVVPVDQAGRFTAEIADYEGLQVFEANKSIIERLKQDGVLIKNEAYDHNYPHCWRTDQPLIYKAVDSWYLKVSAFKDRMVELNQDIRWIPEHIRDGLFGNWLEGARDWNISRSRFWGTPIPVWVSDNPDHPRIDVYGSIEQLERDFGVEVEDLHRPFIDDLTRPNPDDPTGQSTMRRVEDVFDCWFESGAMPFAAQHYPFENKDWFDGHFPGDFIVEYVAQTRGWFYTLMVLGTALFDRAPFKTCMCHGVVLDENRQKLSKRLRNYPDPLEVFDRYGSDALRWYLMASPVLSGGDLLIDKEGRGIAQAQREAILPLTNAYTFFQLYANIDRAEPELVGEASALLDRYILAKLAAFIDLVDAALADYRIADACREAARFMDVLNNWYIRRSRDRFWATEDSAGKQEAFNTLYTVLVTVCQVLAPLAPIVTEKLYRALTGARSVHLTDWPDSRRFSRNEALLQAMDLVRDACSATLAVRERARLRVRLPLKTLRVVHEAAGALAPYADLIADEVNVREVRVSSDLSAFGRQEVKVNPQIGRRLGKAMKDVLSAARDGRFDEADGGALIIAGERIEAGEYEMRLVSEAGDAAEPFGGKGAVVLDLSVDADQEREGLARDLIRAIQTARKDADLDVTDRIALTLEAPQPVADAVEAHKDLIMAETLSTTLSLGPASAQTAELQGHMVGLSLQVAEPAPTS